MKRASVVVVVLLCSVLGTPPTAHAAGSYGAVVEKGMRGCTTDHETGIVMCFEAPSVNPESREVFLQVWPAAIPYVARGGTTAATMWVRSVVVAAGIPRAGRSDITYLVRVDRVLPHLACSDEFRFHASDGSILLQGVVSDCTPH